MIDSAYRRACRRREGSHWQVRLVSPACHRPDARGATSPVYAMPCARWPAGHPCGGHRGPRARRGLMARRGCIATPFIRFLARPRFILTGALHPKTAMNDLYLSPPARPLAAAAAGWCCRWNPDPEHRHRQWQAGAQGSGRDPGSSRPSGPASRSRPGRWSPGPRTGGAARDLFPRAEKVASPPAPTTRPQMELARQSILIRELFEDYKKKNPVTDAHRGQGRVRQVQGTGQRHKSTAARTSWSRRRGGQGPDRADQGGASFEDLAKAKSKDPGSGQNGGDLDFAKPESYVP